LESDTAEDLNLRLLLGIARLKTGDKEGAFKEFQRVAQQGSLDSDIAWLGMAEIYRSKGDWVKSMATLRQIEAFQYTKKGSLALAKKMLEEMEADRKK
jgi:Tfp pilus assembly protein PilF